MKDKVFLAWLHDRLELVHGEDANMDFMSKLRSIILAMPNDQETPNTGGDIHDYKLDAQQVVRTKLDAQT